MNSQGLSRLNRELVMAQKNFSESFQVAPVGDDITEWIADFTMPSGTVYAGETYKLRFRFPFGYPMEAPEVTFMGTSPKHEHVYSNGFICLSTLYDGWSPLQNVSSVVLSIISMLSSAKKKSLPKNNKNLIRQFRGRSSKEVLWEFEDETC